MKTERDIITRLALLKDDSRLRRPSATILENAPLALIQLELETRIHALEWVLEYPLTVFPLVTRAQKKPAPSKRRP